ncbi:uncharacterized protein LOC143180033 [Calliopsis andreniformis]|uniref:uncharacterized protein LOC143180033 n=1 Tax=Calliopsis andreniformis TaxID=337506 RepID=UPI003FCE6114
MEGESAVCNIEDIVRKVLEKLAAQPAPTAVIASTSAAPQSLMEALPEFGGEKKLHERLNRALSYDSSHGTTYAEYARTKLAYLEQTHVAFKQEEYVKLIIGAITDQHVRQAMINGQYQTTSALLVGISQLVKAPKEKEASREESREQHRRERLPKRRCYGCSEYGHTVDECRKRKLRSNCDSKGIPEKKAVISCNYCLKKGHNEAQCWSKQRALRNKGTKSEVNACASNAETLTPICIRDEMLQCLLDSGAECSLIKETVVKKIGSHIIVRPGTFQGLGGQQLATLGCVTEVVKFQDIAVEIDLFVMPDPQLVHDVIIGKNVLDRDDLRMVTDSFGLRLERLSKSSVRSGPSSEG